jgi:phosphoribosyl 1,2-cyclic phosphodiesterase
MAVQICSLNSGSNGNCYYVGNQTHAVLIDVGISARETKKRLLHAGLDIKKVAAIFISHEHSDHVRGVSVLANKYNIPVYINQKTAQNGPFLIRHIAVNFINNQPIQIGTLTITPFSKLHDAADPCSFFIQTNNTNISVITDIGTACTNVQNYFAQSHAAILESNYDAQMLQNGSYPQVLKNRITNGHGHISNAQALQLVTQHKNKNLQLLLLAHLSAQNNTPQIVANTFSHLTPHMQVHVLSRYQASPVYTI